MKPTAQSQAGESTHALLDSGVEFAADLLPERNTVAMCFRMLTGLVDDPPQLTGISSIVERGVTTGGPWRTRLTPWGRSGARPVGASPRWCGWSVCPSSPSMW